MNWKLFWDQKAKKESILDQVGRVSNQTSINDTKIIDSVNHLIEIGDIHAQCEVLDVCCGNGFFTSKIRPYCSKITGIDFSTNLINEARKNYPDIAFHELDITQHTLPDFISLKKFDRITLCFSFQYFETIEAGTQVLKHLVSLLNPQGKIILTDIPDQAKFFTYYHTFSKLIRLIKQKLTHKNDMGKFWSEDELHSITKELGMVGEKINQPKHLPYAHYRMDYVIRFNK